MTTNVNHIIEMHIPGSTSNLGAGFDTFGLAVSVYLKLRAKPAANFQVDLSGEGTEMLPKDESNLVIQSYLRACKAFGLSARPFALEIHNEIPLRRGLGSSGAAIAAGLALAHLHTDQAVPLQRLLELGCQIEGHPENLVASMLGGFSVNCYDAGRLQFARFDSLPALKAVLLIPELTISTADARRLLPDTVPFADAVANVQRAGLLVAGLLRGDSALLREAVRDRLHQPYRNKLIPRFDDILNAAYQAGALAAFLSGSGSTLLGLVSDLHAGEEVRAAMQALATEAGLPARSKIVDIDLDGARVANSGVPLFQLEK